MFFHMFFWFSLCLSKFGTSRIFTLKPAGTDLICISETAASAFTRKKSQHFHPKLCSASLISTVGVFPKPWFGMTQSNRCSEFFSVIQRITCFYLFIPPFFKGKKEPLPPVWWDCQCRANDSLFSLITPCSCTNCKWWLVPDPGSVWELWTRCSQAAHWPKWKSKGGWLYWCWSCL